MMTELTTIFIQTDRSLTQPSPDNLILLHLDSGEYYALDEVGARVWGLCDGTRPIYQIVNTICDEYDAPADVIQNDVCELLADLSRAKLVIKAN